MAVTENARSHREKMVPGYFSKFLETGPEFIERFDSFASDEVVQTGDMDGRARR